MTAKPGPARPAKPGPPPACPACGKATSENFTRPQRAGLHCHKDKTDLWVTHCGVIICAPPCGLHYHRHTEATRRTA